MFRSIVTKEVSGRCMPGVLTTSEREKEPLERPMINTGMFEIG